MFYTPNREDFVINLNMLKGMKQDIFFGEVNFNMNYLKKQNLTTHTHEYFPLVIALNFSTQKQEMNAFLSYFEFKLNQNKDPNGVKLVK